MTKTLFTATFLINVLFMILTTLLPLLVYNSTHSYSNVGYILLVFMIAMIGTRLFMWIKDGIPKKRLLFGAGSFLLAFVLLSFFINEYYWYFPGSILFGVGVGIIPPLLLTYLTKSTNIKENSKNVGYYNGIVAVASAISPIIGEYLYSQILFALFFLWIFGALLLLICAINIAKNDNIKIEKVNISLFSFFKNQKMTLPFIILTVVSITFGTVISYLPIYFDKISISIGIYYLFFWSAYTAAQFCCNC